MIEVQNLSKIYGDYRAVDDISFQVGKGEIVGFLGPNGAGKTTTMRILSCFMAPTGGTARIAGHDILEESYEVRRNIGYLPENVPLYLDMTVREYLGHMAALRGVPKSKRPERIEAALDAGKVEDRAETLIRKLSRGLRQRVGIAQSIVHNPPVLILDEPSAGLDPRQRVEARRFIKSLAKDHTIILSTHILPDVQETCSRVVIINGGRIVAQDTTEQISAARGGDRVTLIVRSPSAVAEQRLTTVNGVSSVRFEKLSEGGKYLLEMQPAADAREEVARLAVTENWGLLELSRQRTSLEDIFLELTTTD